MISWNFIAEKLYKSSGRPFLAHTAHASMPVKWEQWYSSIYSHKVITNNRALFGILIFFPFGFRESTDEGSESERGSTSRTESQICFIQYFFPSPRLAPLFHNCSSRRVVEKKSFRCATSRSPLVLCASPGAAWREGERWIKYYHGRSESYFILFGHDSDRAEITIYESNIKNEILNGGAISLR